MDIDKPKIFAYNGETDETVIREMTDEEIEELRKTQDVVES